jgi:hypothetical protein
MTRFLSWSALGVVLLVGSSPALAQAPRPERPYRGLFGSGTGDAGQLLTATVTAGGGYDDNILADMLGRSGVGTTQDARAGVVSSISGSLAYSAETEPMSLGLSLGSTARYYPDGDGDILRATQGGMTLGVRPRAGTSVSFDLSAAQQPYQFSSVFPEVFEPAPGDAPVPDLDPITSVDTYFRYGGGASLSQRFSRRASFSANYRYQRADRGELERSFVNQTAGAGLTYNIGRGLDLRAGYVYGEARYTDDTRHQHHSIDAGVNYNRNLSFSRRTELSFSTGTAAVQSNDRLRFTVTGHATLKHEIGRTWNAWAGYSRQVLINETFPEPVLVDALSAGLGGFLSRRVQFTSTVRAALGRQGLEQNAPGFDAIQASSTLSYAMTRYMKLGLTYSYYQQSFEENVRLAAGTPTNAERNSIRATVSLWAPLFQRTRRTDASR